MWNPRSAEEFEAAVTSGALDEAHDFDAKRELPSNGKELAKDIAAMTTDGGMLVYGVGEDENGRPRVLAPIKLAGAAERIDQIAQHSITGNPRVEFQHIRHPDDGSGYLLVRVPASTEAPHQVTVGDDRRFYGRGETGNRRLSEEEISRLYERRRAQLVDRTELLSAYIAGLDVSDPTAGQEAFLYAVAQPAIPDDSLWDEASKTSGGDDELLRRIRERIGSIDRKGWGGGGDLGSALNWRRTGADKWSLDTTINYGDGPVPPRKVSRADFSMDGRCGLFFGGAAGVHRGDQLIAYELPIALTLVQFLAGVGVFLEQARYRGDVDVAMSVVGLRGAVSSFRVSDFGWPSTPYGDNIAIRSLRCHAAQLQEDPHAAVRELTGRLMHALHGSDLDPLAGD